ncbi:hypothetical protein K491DRAFT_345554 [Lophiostoma macrostomum CBS 122681]|uniref:Ubiquitin-like protease family profile domain-containing protein n=1 Tax=Lophiostoma macrostomum CBS 122681 TaxID=1314788 RepID=A0A6A6TBI7_9PLEO|nr:hypothetical protein K491DRAFT_345554 [Lophiostoma macrostomum CBS 122681]
MGSGFSTSPAGTGSDSNKRRKTRHESSPIREIVDLSGEVKEDDCIEVHENSRPGETLHSHHFQRPTSSKSQPSIDGSITSLSKRSVAPLNEFSTTDGMISRRKKVRKSDTLAHSARQSDSHFSRYGAATEALTTVDDEGLGNERTFPSYRSLSENIAAAQQISGPDAAGFDEDELHVAEPASLPIVRPHETPISRINPSTKPRSRPVGEPQHDSTDRNQNLRDRFNRNGNEQSNTDEIEVDELAGDHALRHRSGHGRPSAHSVTVNSSSKRSKVVSSPGWPLAYARSYHLKVEGPELVLRSVQDGGVLKGYEIVPITDDNPSSTSIEFIEKAKINRVDADDFSRVRLRGPLSHFTGRQYWYDLEFQNTKAMNSFRQMLQKHVPRIFIKPQSEIVAMFNNPLIPNVKIGIEAPLADPEHASQEYPLLAQRVHNGIEKKNQRPPRRGLLVDNLDRGAEGVSVGPKPSNGQPRTRTASRPVESLESRPRRSTRSSQSAYAEVGNDSVSPIAEQPSKFSIEVGLGQPWNRPVQFGAGRRRALVNFEDMLRLDEGEYLNDALVDFYMIYLLEQAKNIPPNKVHFFNTHFYNSLTRLAPNQKGSINYAAVARWTAREDIFNCDYIVVPVCEATHWYLAIICNVSNISRKPILADSDQSSPATKPRSDLSTEPQLESTGDQTDAAPPSPTNANGRADPTIGHGMGEDVDLFDHEHTITSNDPQTGPTASVSVKESSPATTTQMQRLSINDDMPTGILGDASSYAPSSKSRDKRKTGPVMKKYDPDAPIIMILDSLGNGHPKAVRALKDYIYEEGSAKRGMEANITQNVFYIRGAHIPMQDNYTDCGVYLLAYVQKFLADPRDFVTKLLTREMSAETDWPDMSAPLIRSNMRDILQRLSKQQEEDHRQEKKIKKHIPPAITTPPVEENKPALMSPIALKPQTTVENPSSYAVARTPAGPPAHPDKISRKGSPRVVVEVKTPTLVPPRSNTQSTAKSQERGSQVTSPTHASSVTKLFVHNTPLPTTNISRSRSLGLPPLAPDPVSLPATFPREAKEQIALRNEPSNSPKRLQPGEDLELATPKRRKLEEPIGAATRKSASPEYSTRSGKKKQVSNEPRSAPPKHVFTRASKSPIGRHQSQISQNAVYAQGDTSLDPFKADENVPRPLSKAARTRRSSSLAPSIVPDKPSAMSPKPAHAARGSSVDPIMIDDSQDTVRNTQELATPRSQRNRERTPRTHNSNPSAGRTPQLLRVQYPEDADERSPTPPLQQQHSPLRRDDIPPGSVDYIDGWSGFPDDGGDAEVPETPPEEERTKDLWIEGNPLPL